MILLMVNFGTLIATFCMIDFAYGHFSKTYAGLVDLVIRLILACGILINCLLIPIWLQKAIAPDLSPLLFVIGMPIGVLAVTIQRSLLTKGKIKWSGKN